MKSRVTALLLLTFLGLQWYWGKMSVTQQVHGLNWLTVSHWPGQMVMRRAQAYLVSRQRAAEIQANGAQVTIKPVALRWVERPQPSGAGVWKVAYAPSQVPLQGTRHLVVPAPNGRQILWIDASTGRVYLSQADGSHFGPLNVSGLGPVTRVLWAPDSQAAALWGQGPEGTGLYLWDGDNNLTPVALPYQSAALVDWGFFTNQTVLVAFSNGKILWQGHGSVALPPLTSVAIDAAHAEIVGLTANHVVWWQPNHLVKYPRPDVKWVGRPKFSENGTTMAVLAQTMGGQWRLLCYHGAEHLIITLPFARVASYQLAGFLGDHWILVSVPSGAHRGVYAWWVTP